MIFGVKGEIIMKYFEKVATPSAARVLQAVQSRLASTAPKLSPKLKELINFEKMKGGGKEGYQSVGELLKSPAAFYPDDLVKGQKNVDWFQAPMSQEVKTEIAMPLVSSVQKLFPNLNRAHPEVKKYFQGAESSIDSLITKGYEGAGSITNPTSNPDLAKAIAEIMALK